MTILTPNSPTRNKVNGGAATRSQEQTTLIPNESNEQDSKAEDGSESRLSIGGRILLLLVCGAALTCSVYTAYSCQFLHFASPAPSRDLDFFPVAVTEGDDDVSAVGIFFYSTSTTIATSESSFWEYNTCLPYGDDKFWHHDASPFFWTSQLAAVVAPCFATLGLLIHGTELFFCRFLGSALGPIVLFLLASIAQGYTFVLYGESGMCIGTNTNECKLGNGGVISVVAIVLYYCCTVILCFLPRPGRYICGRRNGKSNGAADETWNGDNVDEEQPSSPSTKRTARSTISVISESGEGHDETRSHGSRSSRAPLATCDYPETNPTMS